MYSLINGGIAELQCLRSERLRFPEYYERLAQMALGQVQTGDAMTVTYPPVEQAMQQPEMPEAQTF